MIYFAMVMNYCVNAKPDPAYAMRIRSLFAPRLSCNEHFVRIYFYFLTAVRNICPAKLRAYFPGMYATFIFRPSDEQNCFIGFMACRYRPFRYRPVLCFFPTDRANKHFVAIDFDLFPAIRNVCSAKLRTYLSWMQTPLVFGPGNE